jgi:carbonic anhydrase
MSLHDLVTGWHKFKRLKYAKHQTYLQDIATNGVTKPLAVITCIDPRLNLNWITSQRTGLLAQHQTLGGIIPPFGRHSLSQEAYLQYAIERFDVDHIAVVGHMDCALVKALLQPRKTLAPIRAVRTWSDLARDTREAVAANFSHLTGEELVRRAVQTHTLLQVEHLMTYPVVQNAIAEGRLQVHPMIYDIAEADLLEYCNETEKFELLSHKYGEEDGGISDALATCHEGCEGHESL